MIVDAIDKVFIYFHGNTYIRLVQSMSQVKFSLLEFLLGPEVTGVTTFLLTTVVSSWMKTSIASEQRNV